MRTVAPYSDQATVWVDVVSRFQWKKIIFIHSSDEEGRAMLGKFQNKAEDRGIEVRTATKLLSIVQRFDAVATICKLL